MKPIIKIALLALSVSIAGSTLRGSGVLIPKDHDLPPLAIKHQRVDIQIKDGAATARIEQVFQNSVNRPLEATYVFPLPANAAISDFAMTINGERKSGELLEKDKARKIYEDIVRRMKDPGLLEYMGGQLFRVRVFPVPAHGEQKIEIEYSQTVDFDSGVYRYVYPLRTGEKASRTLEDFTVSARLLSKVPLKNIYSPSHQVGISRKSDHEAVIGFENEQALLDRDFVLYYTMSRKEFGLNLLTHRAENEDGYFMMMLSPRVRLADDAVLAKDVTFVLDTSGSMSGVKIEQARKALEYCVGKLHPDDRFNIVRFSTDVEVFRDELAPANPQNREEALKFIENIEARGGTDIHGALTTALRLNYDRKRPNVIAFLTDGKPTIGESDIDTIVAQVEKLNTHAARVFVFGVGDQVNTHLLDRVSGNTGGLTRYVKQNEDIEVKLSSFADKMSQPVLARLKVEMEKVKARQMHPRELPDLFAGDQLIVFGRYEEAGHVAIRLTGEINGEQREFVYEADFPAKNVENSFIPRLWATRRVGYLLDEIRLKGEQAELKDEVLALSKQYGIMTPYTSYLVVEDEQPVRPRPPVAGARPPRPTPVPRHNAFTTHRESAADVASTTIPVFESEESGRAGPPAGGYSHDGRARLVRPAEAQVDSLMRKDSGQKAVQLSEAIHDYKQQVSATADAEGVRHVAGRLFNRVGERWVDSRYRQEMKTRKITFGSDEYFRLLQEHPELKPVLALGRQVTVVIAGEALEIGE